MSKKTYLPFIEADPISNLPLTTTLEPGNMLLEAADGTAKKISTEVFYQLLHKIAVPITTADAGPFVANSWYKPMTYSADPGTNYPNAGNLKAIEGYDTLFFYTGTAWQKYENRLPQAKIDTWVAASYSSGKQVFYDEIIYEASENVLSSDVPGTSAKWKQMIVNSQAVKEIFSSVIKFDKLKKYSVINQVANINFSYNSAGALKNSMVKVEVISNGTSNITFSADFDVTGEVDKTKNQVIFFTRYNSVEFKISAVIMNVAKSGIIDIGAEAQAFINKLTASGSTVDNPLKVAINNFFNSAMESGYLGKLKGLYLSLGDNQESRLLNAVTGPNATIGVGTVSTNGIEGVINTNINLSTMAADNYSYGFFNNSPQVVNNFFSAGAIGDNSGIGLYPLSPNGIVVLGPNTGSYKGVANTGNSSASYIVTRSSATLSTVYKDGVSIMQHTDNQTGFTLPNVNFGIGGWYQGGGFVDDNRILKWGFMGASLTSSEVASLSANLANLMTAIGR